MGWDLSSRVWIASVLLAAGRRGLARDLTTGSRGSTLRSDLRATAPKAVPRVRSLLQGDVVFTNFEAAVALPGQSVTAVGGGFWRRPRRSMRSRRSASTCCRCRTITRSTCRRPASRTRSARSSGAASCTPALARPRAAAAPSLLRAPAKYDRARLERLRAIAAGGRARGRSRRQRAAHPGRRQGQRSDRRPPARRQRPNPEDAARILQSHPRRASTRRPGDRLPAQPRLRKSLVRDDLHRGHGRTARAERLAEEVGAREVDAGADIVVMHGAPLLHGVEIYRGRPIFYDLGNFIYNVPPT